MSEFGTKGSFCHKCEHEVPYLEEREHFVPF